MTGNSPSEKEVAALFVRSDSIYKTFSGVDAWDAERDARNWPGGKPCIAHPPCRGWGVLRKVWNGTPAPEDEKALAVMAVEHVRKHGGVVEHPAGSTLWKHLGLPEGEEPDEYGGWTLLVDQYAFGHRAAKRTKLYIVGCAPWCVPPLPIRAGVPRYVVTNSHGMRKGDPKFRSRVTNKEAGGNTASIRQMARRVSEGLFMKDPLSTDLLLDGDSLGEGRVLSTKGGYRVAVYRCACGREQTAAHPDFKVGIGPKSAEAVGWVRSVDRWLCPFCSGNKDKLYAVFDKKVPNG